LEEEGSLGGGGEIFQRWLGCGLVIGLPYGGLEIIAVRAAVTSP
jgi:hypothetical protein